MEDKAVTKKKFTFRAFVKIIKDTAQGFSDDNIPRLSASLAYATLFSIIPFLSLLITIGTFFQADLTVQLYAQLQQIIGPEVVEQLKELLDSAEKADSSTLATIITLGVTVFGATTIFAEVQSSLNTIWGIKAVPKKG